MSRTNVTRAMLIALVIQGLGFAALAEPTRKPARKSQPASMSHTAPDVTSTIPGATSPHVQDDETLPKPFDLPTAPRARMRACGEKWQAIKMSGKAEDQTWRDFATSCLVELDGPKRPPP